MFGRKYTLQRMNPSPGRVKRNVTLTFESGRIFHNYRRYRLMKGSSDDGKPCYHLYMPDEIRSNFTPLIDVYDKENIARVLAKRGIFDPSRESLEYPDLVELLKSLRVNESTVDDFVEDVLRPIFPLPINFCVDDGYVGVERDDDDRSNGYLSMTVGIGFKKLPTLKED